MEQEKKKIAVIEDDRFLSKALKEKFGDSGFNVQPILEDGMEVLEAMHKIKPDIVLLDLVMKKKSGFEVLAELRLDNELKDIPVIILSNLSQESDIQKCKELGAVEYLIKSDTPISMVMERVMFHLASREK